MFVNNFFFQKLTPSNVGKIGKKGKIVCHKKDILQKLTPGNIGKKGKKGKIVCY